MENVPENLGPETMEVGGLKEFLQVTAPEVDQGLVDQRLKELGVYISHAPVGTTRPRITMTVRIRTPRAVCCSQRFLGRCRVCEGKFEAGYGG